MELLNLDISTARSRTLTPIRVLNPDTARTRRLRFVAFELVIPSLDTVSKGYEFIAEQGFSVVPHVLTDDPVSVIKAKQFDPEHYELPVDGNAAAPRTSCFTRDYLAAGSYPLIFVIL